MTAKTIEAWLLHKQWAGETSVRLTLLTRDLGLMQAVYKGARSLKKHAVLQPFTSLWVSLDARYDRYFIRSIEASCSTFFLTGNALFSGLYMNELLYYALNPLYQDVALYTAYQMALTQLSQSGDRLSIESVLRRFEWVLLRSCGYLFSFTKEAGTGLPVQAEKNYYFVAGEGFFPDSQGVSGAILLALAQDDLEKERHLRVAKKIMRQAIDHLLGGKEIKSRSLFHLNSAH